MYICGIDFVTIVRLLRSARNIGKVDTAVMISFPLLTHCLDFVYG